MLQKAMFLRTALTGSAFFLLRHFMHHCQDLTKLPEEILVDLINKDNPGAALTTAAVSFKIPSRLPEGSARNTEVVVYAKRGSGMRGEVRVWYNRLDIAKVIHDVEESPVIELGTAARVRDLIPEINERFGINLTSDDYIDASLPASANEPGTNTYPFTFQMKSESLPYFGEVAFTVRTNEPVGIWLNTVITDRVLNIFTYTPPP